MRKFISKSFLFLAILLMCIYVISKLNLYEKPPINTYLSAIKFKHARIDSFKNVNQLIVTGGSSVPFGLNSKTVQKFVKKPVTNLGLNAGLGYDFILNEAKSILKPNHVLIISLEPDINKEGYIQLKNLTCRYFSDACNYYTQSKYQIIKQKISSIFKDFQNNINFILWPKNKNKTNEIYALDRFDKYGDIIGNHGNYKKILTEWFHHDNMNKAKEITRRLNQFNDYCNKIGANCYYTPAPISRNYFISNKEFFDNFISTFETELKMQMIGEFETFVFHDSLFYDSHFHLNQTGAKLRTELLIKAMDEGKISY